MHAARALLALPSWSPKDGFATAYGYNINQVRTPTYDERIIILYLVSSRGSFPLLKHEQSLFSHYSVTAAFPDAWSFLPRFSSKLRPNATFPPSSQID
jgi:hypothetical protein